jgi:hypothetical protein
MGEVGLRNQIMSQIEATFNGALYHLVVAKAGKKDPIDSLLGKSVLDLAKIN